MQAVITLTLQLPQPTPAAGMLTVDLPWSLGKQWVWEWWESPPLILLQDLQRYCTSRFLGIHLFSWDGMWPIWRYRLSSTFGNFPCLKRDIGNKYKSYICIYTKYQQRLTLELTTFKVHILPDQSFIQKHSPGLLFHITKIYSSTGQRPWRFPKKSRTTSLKLGEIQGVWAL